MMLSLYYMCGSEPKGRLQVKNINTKLLVFVTVFGFFVLPFIEAQEALADGGETDMYFVGASAVFPCYYARVNKNGSRKLVGVGIAENNMIVDGEGGLTVKLDFTGEAVWTDDIPYFDGEIEQGASFTADLCIGYAFVRRAGGVLALCGSAAVLHYCYTDSGNAIYGGKTLSTIDIDAWFCGLGADLIAIKCMGKSVSLFVDVSAYYLFGQETLTYSDDYDGATYAFSVKRNVFAGVTLLPAVGVCWKY